MRIADQARDRNAVGQTSARPPCRPKSPLDGRISGSAAAGTPNTSSSSVVPATSVRRLSSCVRDALVASHACTAPPVRFQSTQLSTVPAHSSPASARGGRSGSRRAASASCWPRTADRSSGRSSLRISAFEAALAQRRRRRPPCGGTARRCRGRAAARCGAPRPAPTRAGW